MVSFNRSPARVSRLSLPHIALPSVSRPSLPRPSLPRGRRSRRPEGGVDFTRALEAPRARALPQLSFPTMKKAAAPSLPSVPSLPALRSVAVPSLPALRPVRLPGGTLNRYWLVSAAVVCLLLVAVAAIIHPAAPIQAAAPAAKGSAAKTPASAAKASAAATAAADPFAQRALNTELRALRTAVGAGESARNMLVLGDGTMGALLVDDHQAVNVMASGKELVREPIEGWSSVSKEAVLDLRQVRGAAPTTILAAAKAQFHLPTAELATLKLAPSASGSKTFIWTATFHDADRTVLYARADGTDLGTSIPANQP